MRQSKEKKGFSTIELSFVVTIGALLIGAVVGGKALIDATNSISERLSSKVSVVGTLKNLALWYDATSEDAFDSVPSNGGDVTTWKNINPQVSGTGDLTVFHTTCIANSPTYAASGVSGKPSIRFDGSSCFRGDITHATDKFSAIYVGQRVVADAFSGAIGFYNSANVGHDYDTQTNLIVGYEATSASVLQSFRNFVATGFTHPGNAVPYIFTTIIDGANNTAYLNGVASTPAASSGPFDFANIIVGGRYISGNAYELINQYIGEIIVVKRNLTEEERKEIEQYLATKWDITVDHS